MKTTAKVKEEQPHSAKENNSRCVCMHMCVCVLFLHFFLFLGVAARKTLRFSFTEQTKLSQLCKERDKDRVNTVLVLRTNRDIYHKLEGLKVRSCFARDSTIVPVFLHLFYTPQRLFRPGIIICSKLRECPSIILLTTEEWTGVHVQVNRYGLIFIQHQILIWRNFNGIKMTFRWGISLPMDRKSDFKKKLTAWMRKKKMILSFLCPVIFKGWIVSWNIVNMSFNQDLEERKVPWWDGDRQKSHGCVFLY